MRFFFFCISIFYLSLLQASFDVKADQDLYNAIHSPAYSNSTIFYPFQGSTYPIQVIHNPEREILWGNTFEVPFSSSLIVIADLPSNLVRHLKESFPETEDNEDDHYIDLRGRSYIDDFKKIAPIVIYDQIENPYFDTQIKECFASETFVNKVFYYYINDKYYRVRIIHNPQRASLSASKKFKLNPGEQERSFTITWDAKYGIIIDKEAPRTLVDHLSSLINISYWDWYFNFKVYNGANVEYRESSFYVYATITTTYSLDTWFHFTEDLKF